MKRRPSRDRGKTAADHFERLVRSAFGITNFNPDHVSSIAQTETGHHRDLRRQFADNVGIGRRRAYRKNAKARLDAELLEITVTVHLMRSTAFEPSQLSALSP